MGMLDIYINGILPIMGTVCMIIHFGKAHEFKEFKTTTAMEHDFKMMFGTYKGQMFSKTPASYQKWLLEQSWFKRPTTAPTAKETSAGGETKLDKALKVKPPTVSKSWNGHSGKGQGQYDSYFEYEKMMADALDSDHFNETFGY